jgi:RimJ/RimL family protein N-acetyltransferase
VLAPVGWQDRDALRALKADPASFALMLGGVRTAAQADAELASDLAFWARHGAGMWTVRGAGGAAGHDGEHEPAAGPLLGITGLHERPDGRGVGLRFAFWPATRGKGIAREAAGAALRFAHDRAGVPRIVAVAREDNTGSRSVLGAIGMRERGEFWRDGHRLIVHESLAAPRSLDCRDKR